MNISFHTGKTAMIAQARALNVYGNNIANINTVGYQTLRPDFADCIYETERAPEGDWQTGHGTYIQKTDLMFSESFFQETERPQDMAIAGEGWFAVQDRNGNVNYTRDGKFGITQLDGTWYLVSSQGEYVLDYDKNRIVVPFESVGKQTIIGGTNWQDIANRIGTFSVTGGGAEKIRYTYSGTSNATNPPRAENPQLTATPSSLDPLTAATISLPATGYFAVRADANSVPTYTRDTTLSITTYNGRYVLGSTNGDILLDDKFRAISMIFKPSSGDISMDHINTVMTRQTGEGENAVTEYAFRNAETGLTEYKAIADLTTIGAVRDAESGKFFLATAEGEYLLNSGGNRIEVRITEGDYFMTDWDATIANVGVFNVPDNELSTTDNKRYDGTATASTVDKLLAYDAPGGITLGDKDGFFALETANGIRYARNAKLDIMQGDDGAWYLSTVQGEYVLDANNARIMVAEPTDTHNVDWAGVRDAVGVFVFPNPYGLEAMGSNRYRETQRSGEAEADRNMEKLQNALITSNVELSDMMVKLIETQRAYQLSSRVVTTSDELAQISNNLR